MKNILFLCVGNSARSQMAEGLARHYFQDQFHVQSAGSQPSKVNPLAIDVLVELGIDISKQYSKSVNNIHKDSVDVVITLCAEEVCPVFLGKAQKFHWPLKDPAYLDGSAQEKKEAFRLVRDEILAKLKGFALSF